MSMAYLETGHPGLRAAVQTDRPEPGDDALLRTVARELHDGVAQTLQASLVQLEVLKLEAGSPENVRLIAGTVQEAIRDSLEGVRTLLYGMRGQDSPGANFISILEQEVLAGFQSRSSASVTLVASPPWRQPISNVTALNVLKIIRESLNNVAQHSQATEVEVTLSVPDRQTARVTVRDNGKGFASPIGFGAGGLGMVGIRERAMALGGEAMIGSGEGGGTTVEIDFPRKMLR